MRKPVKVWSILVLIGTLMANVAKADTRGGSQEISDMALGILKRAGVGTDTPSLLNAMRLNPDSTVRWVAIDILGQRRERQALEPLLKVLKGDPERVVRETAALALARMGDKTGLAALKEFLKSPSDPGRQLYTAARLAELGDAIGYPYLCEAARSENAILRQIAVENLVPFIAVKAPRGCEVAPADLMISLAGDKSPDVRYTVLLYLPSAVSQGLDRERARAVARKAQSDPDPKVREEAEFVINAWRLEESRDPGSGEKR